MFPFWDAISSGLIANALIIWILVKLNRLYDQTQPKTLEFNIGLIVGFSILLYEPIAILIPGFKTIKEWAYAGLFFDLAAAVYSGIAAAGKFDPQMLGMLMWIVPGILSYYFWKKKNAS